MTAFLAQIEQRHIAEPEDSVVRRCTDCFQLWPCDAIRCAEKLKACVEALEECHAWIEPYFSSQSEAKERSVLINVLHNIIEAALAKAKEA